MAKPIEFKGFLGGTLIAVMFGIVFLVIAYATPHWVTDDSGPSTIDSGLWDVCECEELDQDGVEDWLRAVQVLGALGIFMLFVLVVILLMVLCVPHMNRAFLIWLFIVIAAITTILLFVAMVVAGVEYTDDDDNQLNYSYAFLVISGAFALVATILSIFYVCEIRDEWKQECDTTDEEEEKTSASESKKKEAEAAEDGEL